MRRLSRLATTAACLMLLSLFISGCASLAEGITRALTSDQQPEKDTRQCHIRGPAFHGLAYFMAHQNADSRITGRARELKILMVHGIGSHIPGYSTRVQENLARALGLNIVSEQPKEIIVQQPLLFPGEKLGIVRVSRFSNSGNTKSFIFYELTWSGITEPEKHAIDYDTSGEYSYRRADMNQLMKVFINNHIPDPLIYLGDDREKIQAAVAQTFCWMVHYDWNELSLNNDAPCPVSSLTAKHLLEDDYVFLTHSLGSRILTDSLQRLAAMKKGPEVSLRGVRVPPAFVAAMQDKEFTVFMFANQLSLLQLGRTPPKVKGQIADYCTPGGRHWSDRFVKRLHIVAFSDPNDILSWAVPPDYEHKYMDSRLCPTLDNVIINIAEVRNIVGAVELANPAVAHSDYGNDERVMSIVAGGVGTDETLPLVKQRCEWLETK